MRSLRAFIAVIATASLSSTVAAQETIPNWGLCGGIMFQGQKPRPCADGWPCVVLSERSGEAINTVAFYMILTSYYITR